MRHSQLESILTAAIVDYCQKNELYLTELHIQGTVCISSDGTPTLITQLSEKVSTNNNRCDTLIEPKITYEERQPGASVATDHRHVRISRSPSRKHRRRSDPGNRYTQKYASESYREAESYRWAIGSTQVKDVSDTSPYSIHENAELSSASRHDRQDSYRQNEVHGESDVTEYVCPKEEPSEHPAQRRFSQNERYEVTNESVKNEAASGRPTTISKPASIAEEDEMRREQILMQPWRPHVEERVSAAAMAVYAYMHSPTYQTSGSSHHPRLYAGHPRDSRSEDQGHMSRPNMEVIQGHHGGRQQVLGSDRDLSSPPATSASAAVSSSGNPISSPPPRSPRSTPDGQRSPLDTSTHLNSSHYMTFRPTRDLPLHIPGEYVGRNAPLSPPGLMNIKPEAREELHIVTRPMAPHVPGMVSPSAQAAASAMAALSSLQASIMPTASLATPTTKTSPASTVGTSASTTTASSHEDDREESPVLNTGPEEISESPEPTDPAIMDMANFTATGCIQIPDAPVNSHFRKMMLKSLQGKYKVLKTAEGRYKCPVCGVSYVYQPNLRKHLEKVHLGKSYKCEFCGQKFTSVQGYSFHRKVKHRELMPYRCELCRDAFYSYTAFLQHKKRSHSNHPECIAVTHHQNELDAKAAKSGKST